MTLEIAIDEIGGRGDTAIGQDVGTLDAFQGGFGIVFVIEDTNILHRRVVICLGIVIGLFPVVGVVRPSSHRPCTRQNIVGNSDVLDFLQGLVRSIGTPRNEGNAVTTENIAVDHSNIINTVIITGIGMPPHKATRIVVSGAKGNGVIVRVESEAVDEHVLCTNGARNTVARSTSDFTNGQTTDVSIFTITEVKVIVVCSENSDVGEFNVFTLEEAYGNHVESVFTACPNGRTANTIQVFATCIHRTDDTTTCDANITHTVTLDERQVVARASVCPVHTGDHNIVTINNIILIFSHTRRLPQHSTLFNTQLHIVLHLDVGNDVASAVERVITGHNNRTTTLGRYIVNGCLNLCGIVSKGITHSTKLCICDVYSQIGQIKSIGIFREITIVFYLETVRYLHLAVICFNRADEQGREVGDFAVFQAKVETKISTIGCGRGHGGQTINALCIVGNSQLIKIDFLACIRSIQRACDGYGFIVLVSHTKCHLAGIIINSVLTLKSNGVNGDRALSNTYGLNLEATEIACHIRASREVGIYRFPTAIGGYIYQYRVFFCVTADGRCLEVYTKLRGIRVVFQTNKQGVLNCQISTVGIPRGGHDGGGLHITVFPIQGEHQSTVICTIAKSNATIVSQETCDSICGSEFQIQACHFGSRGGVIIKKFQVLDLGGGIVGLNCPNTRGEVIAISIIQFIHGIAVNGPNNSVVGNDDFHFVPIALGKFKGFFSTNGGGCTADNATNTDNLEYRVILKEILLSIRKGERNAHVTVHRGTIFKHRHIQAQSVLGDSFFGGQL